MLSINSQRLWPTIGRQYANTPGNMAHCYAGLATTTASTHYAYPQKDGHAELAWVVGRYTQERSPTPVLTRLDVE